MSLDTWKPGQKLQGGKRQIVAGVSIPVSEMKDFQRSTQWEQYAYILLTAPQATLYGFNGQIWCVRTSAKGTSSRQLPRARAPG